MEKLYTCKDGVTLKEDNKTFYVWDATSDSYEPGQHEVIVHSEYLEAFNNGDYMVMNPSKAIIR